MPASDGNSPVSFYKLFRYAKCSDVLMMLLGALAAFLHGSAFPVAMVIFGDITDAFIDQAKTNTLYPLIQCSPEGTVFNLTLISSAPTNCSELYALPNDQNLTCRSYDDILQSLAGQNTRCLPNGPFISLMNELVYIFIGISALAFLFGVVQIWFFKVPAERQIQKLRLKFYDSILRKEMGWFDVNDTGAISIHFTGHIETVHDAIGDNIGILIQWLSTFLAAIVISLVIQYQLALLLLAIVPFLGLAGYCFTKLGGVFSKLEQKYFSQAGSVAEETLASITTVQVYGGEDKEQRRFDDNLKQTRLFGFYKGLAIGSSVGVTYFLIFLIYSVSFWFGAFLVSRELAELGDVITVFFSILIGAFYVGQAGPNMQKLAEAQAAAAEVYHIIDQEVEVDPLSDQGVKPENFHPTVNISDVTFSFPSRPDIQVLNGLSLSVKPGQKVALVGSSGSGKSTVIKLVQRLYDTTTGEVSVGGVNVKDLNVNWLRKHIGVVSQEPVLFDTTIAENIALGKDDATMEEIEEAAKKANAHSFISSLPDGYDTDVGEGGAQLSGGQKQRIAIARALVRDPKILLLDEATSALDTESERIVQEALDTASAGRTTITIAHRLSTIRDSHVIVCMHKGQVAEMGTHDELMATEGKYFDLVNTQEVQVPPTTTDAERHRSATVAKRRRSATVVKHHRSATVSLWHSTGSFSNRSGRDYLGVVSLVRHGSILGGPQSTTSASRRGSVDDALRDSPSRRARGRTKRKISISSDSTSKELNSLLGSAVEIDLEGTGLTSSYKEMVEGMHGSEEEVEEEEDIPSISFFKLLSLNIKMLPVIVLGCIGAAVNGLIFPSFSIIFGEVVQVFGRPQDEILSGIHPYAAGFLGLGIVSAVCLFIKFVCFEISGFNLSTVVRGLLFKALLRQDKAWYDRPEHTTSALSTMLASDTLLVQGVAGIRIGSLMEVSVSLLAALGVAFGYSWLTALVILGFIPVIVLASVFHYSVASRNQGRSHEALSESTQVAMESVHSIQTVHTLGLEQLYFDRFKTISQGPYRSALWLSIIFGLTYAFSQVIVFFAYIITFRFGALQVTVSTDSVVSAMFQDVYRAFSAIIFVSIGIGAVGAFIPNASKANAAVEKVFKVINRPLAIDSSSELGHKPDNCSGDVQFNAVTFSYPNRKKVKIFDRLNLSVANGSTVGLVGPSGCGKSTVMSLLQRFYDPSNGSVSLDSTNVKDLNLKWLRSQLGLVSQEPVLFDTSIADNIRYGALFRNVSEDEIISAAKQANIHSFIETLPKGYNTNVGAKGTQLSGGQKQRIAIARALVRDPKILLLDEATSALDTESEKVVQEALDKASEGRTTIIIAHRLSTIQNSDKIVVLKGGKVAEEGPHSTLVKQEDGVYYRMLYHQHKAWRKNSEMSHLRRPSQRTSKPIPIVSEN